MRKPVMAGNWKMYKTPAETRAFFEQFKPLAAGCSHCEIVICPPFPNLPAAVDETRGSRIRIGAQNLYWGKEGAVTGEVSGHMIQAVGCTHVIVAHSERRQYFGETEVDVLKKTVAALEANLTPIVCVGERLEERVSNLTEAVLIEQFQGGLAGLTPEEFERIIIAYEPVWAIGTGKTATPDIAADAHRVIRSEARARFGDAAANAMRILYGGSVKPDNVTSLMAQPEIDGALVGGASLDPVSFASIVNF
ncbi:MAG: triose-phosphate isomerase [Acidobacteriota bacterium]|nr:triose-phosphate isomerase [Acidobacteriota bacterium]